MMKSLGYAGNLGGPERATVDRLKLQQMMTAHYRDHSTVMAEWKQLAKPIRDNFGWKVQTARHRQSVPIIVAIWFGGQLKDKDRGDQWAEVMFALWVAVRRDGPADWPRRPVGFRPVFSFAGDETASSLKVRAASAATPLHLSMR